MTKLIEIALSNWQSVLRESRWVTVQCVTGQQLKLETGNSEKRLGTHQIYGACWACLSGTLHMPESGPGRVGFLHQWRVIWSEGLSPCQRARLLCVPG